jgi:ferric-dicitrate binding protein FerR (iron transport regulator)
MLHEQTMENSRIIELMVKKTGKTASGEELQELAVLLSEHPHYAYLYEIVQSLKGSRDHFEKNIPREELVNNGWQQLEGKLNTGSGFDDKVIITKKPGALGRLFIARSRWVAAADLILCFIGATMFYFKNSYGKSRVASSPKIAEIHYGATSKLTLADGTQVWLNAGSRLIYPDAFPDTKREVTLEGEAFFEVTKNPHAPFLVHAGKITVRVLGTKFNVKAYHEDRAIETTLISGKVQVTLNDDPEKEITLSPREKLTVINSSKPDEVVATASTIRNELRYKVQALPANNNNNFIETAWVDHKLVFSNESFDNVATLLERKYNVHIYFKNNKLKQEHISGVFEKESISKVLEILKMTTRFNYSINGTEISLF